MRRLVLGLSTFTLAAAAQAAGPFDPFGVAGIDGKPGAYAPLDGPLTDQAGRSVTLRGLAHGRPILLVPVQHRCRTLCSATLEDIARAAAGRSGEVELVAFGIDPREGRADAALSARRLPPGAAAVTAGPAQVVAVTAALGYRYAWDPRTGQYAHVAATAVLTPTGRLSSWLYGFDPPSPLVRAAIAAASREGVGALGERLILLCYHYDPVAGRYDLPVMMALRAGVGLAALALAALIAALVWRGRPRSGAE